MRDVARRWGGPVSRLLLLVLAVYLFLFAIALFNVAILSRP